MLTNGVTEPLSQEEEQELVRRAIGGCAEAFGQLFERYRDRVFGYLRSRLRYLEDAEDLMQQTFLNAWGAIRRYVDRGAPFLAWLFTIARNLLTERWSKKRLEVMSLGNIPDTGDTVGYGGASSSRAGVDHVGWIADQSRDADPTARIERTEDAERLYAALNALAVRHPEQRDIVASHDLRELDYRSVARALGKSEATVRVARCRALAALRKSMA